jgi:hypothetical protein
MTGTQQTIGWGEWRPDVSDLNQALTQNILNVIPRADGFGPFPGLAALSAALGAPCRGYFCARDYAANTVTIFAGTSVDLFQLNNTTFTWSKVSKGGGPYTALNTDANWDFCQFNNFVVAVQQNVAPQKFNIATPDAAFSDVSGTPPQAAYCSVIGGFCVLSGLNSNLNRVIWSGLNDLTNWTAGVSSSDFQDLQDGGVVRGVVGGQLGIVVQDAAIRTMTYSPGSDVIFNFFKIGTTLGALAPWSIINVSNFIFFLSAMGFVQCDLYGDVQMIGQEKVDRTVLADIDLGNLQFCQGAVDPQKNLVYFVYKSQTNSGSYADKGLVYNYKLQRWSPFAVNVQFIENAIKPALTLEGLDFLAPGNLAITGAVGAAGLIRISVASTSTLSTGQAVAIQGVVGTVEANNGASRGWWIITVINGTQFDLQGSTFSNAYVSGGTVGGSIDAMTTSLDAFATVIFASIMGFDSTNTLGTFTGANLAATFETAEQGDPSGQRLLVKGFRPITDAPSVNGSIGYRETLSAMRSYTTPVAMDAYGFVGQMQSTRYARAKIVIPSGTTWSYAMGVQPDVQPDGYA